MADFREIIDTIRKFIEYGNNKLTKDASSYDIAQFKYEFYSFTKDKYGDIGDINDIFRSDPYMDKLPELVHNVVYGKSSFLRAAIRLSKKP
jgi:aminoglycoside N3'-acetyltransferase